MMSTATVTAIPAQASATQPTRAKKTRRSRQQGEEVARYFLAKDGSSPTKPELGEEASSQGEALIKAFQSKSGIVYVLHAYKAEAEMQGGSPILVKKPLQK
jgi:hypothetical protein